MGYAATIRCLLMVVLTAGTCGSPNLVYCTGSHSSSIELAVNGSCSPCGADQPAQPGFRAPGSECSPCVDIPLLGGGAFCLVAKSQPSTAAGWFFFRDCPSLPVLTGGEFLPPAPQRAPPPMPGLQTVVLLI